MSQDYQIRSGALAGYGPLVEQLGGDSTSLLAQSGLTHEDLQDTEKRISFARLIGLLEHSAKRLNCPDFGLQLASMQSFQALGPLGLLLQNSETARQALTRAQRYMAVHSTGEYWRLQETNSKALVARVEIFHGISHARQYKELSFGVCWRLIQTLFGPEVKLDQIEFAHAPISNLAVYRRYFNCEVRFNQENDRLMIPGHYLDAPLPTISPADSLQLEGYIHAMLLAMGDDVARQVKTLILQTMGIQESSIEHIAPLLNLHKRTLQRRLKQQGLSFKDLLSQVRMDTACWHLEASEIDITLLSELLGYSDISGFSRGFKRATGYSPLQWRKRKQQQAAGC